MKNNNLLITAAVAIVIGIAAFFGGMQYGKTQTSNAQYANGTGFRSMMGGRNGAVASGRSGMMRNRPVAGTVLSSDDKSITVQLNDGSSKIVIFGNSTSINKASEASKSDLAKGTKVAVFGTENSDGSMTAQNIQINPILRGFGGNGITPPVRQ